MSIKTRSRNDQFFDTINILLLSLLTIAVAYPLYFVFIASVSNPYEVLKGHVIILPKGFILDAYKNVMENDVVWRGYANTIIYTVSGTLYQLALTIPAGFVLSRKGLAGRNILMAYFMFTMYFGGGLIPHYILIKNLGLLDTRAVLIVGGMSIFNMIITRTFYQSNLPDDLYEAARIDGANEYRIFFQMALPLSKAIIAVIALYVMVGEWNSFFSAMLYIDNQNLYPLQLVLRNILLLNQQFKFIDVTAMDEMMIQEAQRRALMAEAMKYSLIIIASIPMLIVFPFVQRYFVKGVMIGAIKG